MIKKVILIPIAVGLLLLLIMASNTVFTVRAYAPPEEVIWTEPEDRIGIAHTEIFGVLERPQVIFDHKKHTEALVKDGKKEWETCKACHPVDKWNDLVFDFPKEVKKKDKDSVMNAYHDQCIECHKKMSGEAKKSGPVACADCHAEKFKLIKVQYPVVEFDFKYHDNHVTKLRKKIGKDDCSLCHHTYDIKEKDETLALVYEKGTEESCYYCHDIGKKRGPELTEITRIAAKKGLTIRKASHLQCLNCHLESAQKAKKDEKVGPVECSKCHTGEYKTIAELSKIPRPDRNQPKRPLIDIENGRMKAVTFEHDIHEKNNKTCRSCHHETLKTCKECHGITGKREGNMVNVANAYHSILSEHSCAGCHGIKKSEKECAGCHHYISPVDIQTLNPKKEACALCHRGKIEGPLTRPPLSVAKLDPEKVKKEVKIKVLENEFEPSKFPHLDIIKKLVKISNDSKLANYFHKDMQTICDGCHHQSRAEAEAKKDTPPYCRNCHSIGYDPEKLNKTRLLSAYHRQCLSCHEMMDLEKGRKCIDCHEEKKEPKSITAVKNFEEPVRFLEKLGW